jgi:hypothetical protein
MKFVKNFFVYNQSDDISDVVTQFNGHILKNGKVSDLYESETDPLKNIDINKIPTIDINERKGMLEYELFILFDPFAIGEPIKLPADIEKRNPGPRFIKNIFVYNKSDDISKWKKDTIFEHPILAEGQVTNEMFARIDFPDFTPEEQSEIKEYDMFILFDSVVMDNMIKPSPSDLNKVKQGPRFIKNIFVYNKSDDISEWVDNFDHPVLTKGSVSELIFPLDRSIDVLVQGLTMEEQSEIQEYEMFMILDVSVLLSSTQELNKISPAPHDEKKVISAGSDIRPFNPDDKYFVLRDLPKLSAGVKITVREVSERNIPLSWLMDREFFIPLKDMKFDNQGGGMILVAPVVLPLTVFPSNEETIMVSPESDYAEGCHNYALKKCIGFIDGETKYITDMVNIQFVKKINNDLVIPGVQSEQLAFVLLHRLEQMNKRFPSPENQKQMQGLHLFLEGCRERVENRINRGVMGKLKE